MPPLRGITVSSKKGGTPARCFTAVSDNNHSLWGVQYLEARVVTNADYHAYNTFDDPEIVNEEDFKAYRWNNNRLMVTLPKAGVVELRVR